MLKPFPISLLLASFALAGCVETNATKSTETPAVTGGDLTGAPARACRTAIAKTTGRPVSDVAVFDVAESKAGITVEATLAGAEAPWRCYADRSGRVSNVMYTGSEGKL
jgi:hypothetical protein